MKLLATETLSLYNLRMSETELEEKWGKRLIEVR
jgi:hypothetical protein